MPRQLEIRPMLPATLEQTVKQLITFYIRRFSMPVSPMTGNRKYLKPTQIPKYGNYLIADGHGTV